ncbi:hypothetical protein [Halobacterium bonnevillei]|uniref:STAS/SEC14 domain-containing protein n=1 Tax=Halobacterium bonnevillei TaxID=2692200 RepID=A0A6B0SKF8_9EURY|nr:hypothetical protein [Halobacterium bonnevillei]MXR22294.1 hypothetical protein [Halobacterium bonnevillei]
MARETYADTADYTIETDDELDAVLHTWTDFTTGEAFRDGSNVLLEAIRETGHSNLLVDTSNIQAHDDEDKAWLQQEWVPKALDAGMEASAMVYSDSVISKMEMESFNEEIEDSPYETFLTDDREEGEAWLAEQ